MNSLTSMSDSQKKGLYAYMQSSKSGETRYLDPSDPKDKSVIETMLSIAGRTKENYPNVYKALNSNGKYTGDQVDKVHLVDSGMTAEGKATAKVWASSNKDSMISGGNLLAFDHDSKDLLGQGENTNVRSGFISCPIKGATAKPAGNKLDLFYMGHVSDTDGSTRFFSYTNSVDTGKQKTSSNNRMATSVSATEDETGIVSTVLAPVTTHGNAQVLIGLGRSTANMPPSNTDYIYIEESGEGTTPFFIVPFTGSAALSGTIDLSSLTAQDLTTNIIVVNTSGAATYIDRATQYTTDADMVAALSVPADPNVLNWDFPYDGYQHGDKGYSTTSSIVYNQGSLASQQISYFYFAFNSIPFTGGGTSAPFYVCSEDSPEEGTSVNCTMIKDLMFYFHCLAAGTLVELEDGTMMPIEKVNERFRVKTGVNGQSLGVTATVQGKHSSLAKDGTIDEVYELKTANGKSLIATQSHMIYMTPNKCRMISHIEVGDSIVTDDGISKVVSNDKIQHSGMFYGLVLGKMEEKAKSSFPTNHANYYAGGILTGDHEVMRHHATAAYHDLDYMLPRIDPQLHVDYTSALADKRF